MGIDLSDLLSGAAVSPALAGVAMSPEASAVASGGITHDGSNKTDRLALWHPPLRSADADILPEKSKNDARSRDVLRSDAYVANGTGNIRDSIIGAQFRLSPQPETRALFGKDDEKWESEFQEEVAMKFHLLCESPRKWLDAQRKMTFTGLIRVATAQFMYGGESFGTAEWFDPTRFNRPYGTAIQMIDPDRLSNPMNHMALNKRLRGGVERNGMGMPVAYWIRNGHLSDARFPDPDMQRLVHWRRVAREKTWGRQMVLHIFDQERADQSRAVSSLATALSEIRMLKHFRITELQRAAVAATYAASFESELPADVTAALGAGLAADGNATTQWMLDYLSAVSEYTGGSNNLHMDGVDIPILPPGTKLNLRNPGAQSPLGDKFEQGALRNIAAALGISYEELSQDYTQTNYSSARAALGKTKIRLGVKKRMVADETANWIYRLWFEEALSKNEFECLKRRNVPSFYEGLNAEAYCKADWIGAGEGQIDPLKETQATLLQLKGGLTTKERAIARLTGDDYRNVARQIKRERELDTYYGNPSIYDQDSKDMENSLSGSPREAGGE